jgi:hypothetical protein
MGLRNLSGSIAAEVRKSKNRSRRMEKKIKEDKENQM